MTLNNTIDINYASRLPESALHSGALHRQGTRKEGFAELAARVRDGSKIPAVPEKSKGGYWEQRMENHKKFMELQQEAAARRRLLLKLQRGEPLSAAELLMGLL